MNIPPSRGGPQPLFLIAPDAEAERIFGSLPGAGKVRVFRTVRHFLDDPASLGAGCVFLPVEVPGEDVRILLAALAGRPGPWAPILVEPAAPPGEDTGAAATTATPPTGEGAAAGDGPRRTSEPRSVESLRATPLSLGFPESLDAMLERLHATEGGTLERLPLLELRAVLAEVGRTRHDINNPLTAALAETQLLLMDIEEGETRDAVQTVELQLRRIRDLVARLSSVRAPAASAGPAPR